MSEHYAHVAMEIRQGSSWQQIASVSEVEPSGSFSNDEPDGRQVYMFGWHENEGPCVWRSHGGVDLANDVIREISSFGLEKIADLKNGPHEMPFIRMGQSLPIRFRQVQT